MVVCEDRTDGIITHITPIKRWESGLWARCRQFSRD
jgi:hypothetical protein